MQDDRPAIPSSSTTTRDPPIFNVPGVVLATIVVLASVHAARVFLLGGAADDRLVLDLAFIPGCYETDCTIGYDRAAGADFWTPLTHAFLHGDWMHLGLNTVWLLAFGAPIARRLGAFRYLVFSIVGALAGAGCFFVLNPSLLEPVVGASGVVSALMGGACRFAFGSAGRFASHSAAPRLTIVQALSDRTLLVFIIVFFATNLFTATSFGAALGGGAQIAWEAHLGGFAFGFLCFDLFDRRSERDFEGT